LIASPAKLLHLFSRSIYPSNIAFYLLHPAFAAFQRFVGQLATARRELICEEETEACNKVGCATTRSLTRR
jgi:hypothetical protein